MKIDSVMKRIKQMLMLTGLALSLGLAQGCAALLSGTAYGSVSYANNKLQVTDHVSLDHSWAAANTAFKDLSLTVTSSQKDGGSGRLEGQNAKDQPVVIELMRQNDNVTDIEVIVGTFDSKANRTEARHVYERMKARY